MTKKILINVIFILPIIYGVYLLSISTGSRFGTNYAYIALPICIGSSLLYIIQRFVLLKNMLESDDITAKSRKSLLMYAALNNLSIFIIIYFVLSIGSVDALIASIIIEAVICVYNFKIKRKRVDLQKELIILDVIMFLLGLNASLHYADVICLLSQ
ncbi:MAG: hypothetical protein K6F91_00805 [Ruminococcus sp.]|nr:hypothetical protein [Ruminococcus sp.]